MLTALTVCLSGSGTETDPDGGRWAAFWSNAPQRIRSAMEVLFSQYCSEHLGDLCEISEQKHRIFFFLLLRGSWLSQSHELQYPTKTFSKHLYKKEKKKKKSKQRIMCTKCSIYFQSCSHRRSEPQIKASGPKGDIFICDALFSTSSVIYVQRPQLRLAISTVNQAEPLSQHSLCPRRPHSSHHESYGEERKIYFPRSWTF